MKPSNLIIIMSDEHAFEFTGCYGNAFVQTPNIDTLASRGTRFVNAYASSPICVPTRASFATGRYIHQNRCWDSVQAYHGHPTGWGHRLIKDGHEVVSIGKLHYRSTEDDNGFKEEILPMHILNGVGWAIGLLRKNPLPYDDAAGYANEIGPGESVYTEYDRRVCQKTCAWLKNRSSSKGNTPWVLFVGFVAPHYPLIAPPEFYHLYDKVEIPRPRFYDMSLSDLHPAVAAIKKFFKYDEYFDERKRNVARQSYFGLCSFLDDNIGKIVTVLKETGLSENTRVIYTSDHGDCLGNRGIWAKSVMYEESVSIPLIMAGPDIPEQQTVATPVTHVDFYPTIVEGVGQDLREEERWLPGLSLFEAMQVNQTDRVAFSEYHDGGSITGSYMIRTGQWKYIYHAGYRPELYDLDNDPQESLDLALKPEYQKICDVCEVKLREICDPEKVNAEAFADQQKMIRKLGGEEKIAEYQSFDFTPVSKGDSQLTS